MVGNSRLCGIKSSFLESCAFSLSLCKLDNVIQQKVVDSVGIL